MDNISAQIKLINKINILKNLDEIEVRSLLEFSETLNYQKGDYIFKEDEPGASIYLVVSGVVKIYKSSPEGISYEIAEVLELDFFGEMSFLDGRLRSAHAVASTPVTLISLDETSFSRFTARHAFASFKFMKNITVEMQKRLRKSNEKLIKNYDDLVKVHKTVLDRNNFLNNIINISNEIIIILDSRQKVSFFSIGAQKCFKLELNQVTGHTLENLFADNNYRYIINEICSGRQISLHDSVLKTSAGDRINVKISALGLAKPVNNTNVIDSIAFIIKLA